MEKESKILVIIVTYKAMKWLKVFLTPFASDRDGLDILVIDNASDDGTPLAIQEEYPFVHVHRRPSNLGFGAANSIGMEWAIAHGYKGVFLLNQDASISAKVIRDIASRADANPEVGLASPVHRSADGCRERGFSNYAGTYEISGKEFIDLQFINAALWYLPRRTLEKVGVFCPLFFHYGEDVDYYNRVLSSGFRAGYFPDVSGVHMRQSGVLSPEKQMHLTYAYHLTEYIHPGYSSLKRLWRGPILMGLNGLKGNLKAHRKGSQRLWQQRESIRLWNNRPKQDSTALRRTMMQEQKAPVLLLLYNRPEHTRRVLEYLMRQPEINDTPLFILSDGAKDSDESRAKVTEVRTIASEVKEKLPNTTLWFQDMNVGLAHNVTEGVSRVLKLYDRVIVVEDDLILSPYFLRWMNDVLEVYVDVPEVAHVHAGTFYTHKKLRNNHTLRFAGSWGWATWQDRWTKYWEPNGEKLLHAMQEDHEAREHFDYGGFQKFTKMLWRQTQGQNNSWAVRWHAKLVLNHLLSVNANPPLVSNGGFDGSGTHSSADNRYSTPVAPHPLYAPSVISKTEDTEAYSTLKHYYARTNNKIAKGWYKLKELLNHPKGK